MLNAIFCRLNRRRRAAAACPWWRWRCVRPTRSTWCSAGASCWRWRPRRRRWRRGTAPQWPSPTSTASTLSNCGSATRPATATTRSTAPTTTDDDRFSPLKMDSYTVLLTHSHSLLQHTRQNEILIPLWTIIHRYIICTMLVDDCEKKWCIPVRFCMLMKKFVWFCAPINLNRLCGNWETVRKRAAPYATFIFRMWFDIGTLLVSYIYFNYAPDHYFLQGAD